MAPGFSAGSGTI